MQTRANMQREMDFTDLIDWGREADFAAVTPSPSQCCVRLLDLLQFIAPEVFIISNEMRDDMGCIPFPRAESEKLKHSWKRFIAMYLTENNRFLVPNSRDQESNPVCTD